VAGDSLTDIAARYDTTVASLQELNGLADPHSLLVGQELLVAASFGDSAVLAKAVEQSGFDREILGESALGHPIEVYRIGQGRHHVTLVGAIHGGYEWNTALLAYRMITHFSVYPERIPADLTLHVIPIANPDGIAAITGVPGPFAAAEIGGDITVGRPNGNGVDLNRNWGCDWSAEAQWGQESVSGGPRPMSEPEIRSLRHYFVRIEPDVVIWLHSAAGLLVPGNCNDIIHPASERAAMLYSALSAYPVGEFNAYRVTGDAADWLAQHKIASFTVELSNHQDLEFDRNLAGLLSLFEGFNTLGEE
jgi:LysM repeat protein